MIFNEYELVVIIRPDLDDPTTYGIVERIEGVITENGGHLVDRDDWGKRKLAYPIQKHLKGHYVLIQFIAPAELITELERIIRITEGPIRFLTVKTADEIDVEVKLEQAAENQKNREERERARAAALAQEQEQEQAQQADAEA